MHPMPAGRLVLLRHGESVFNEARRFSGWSDCPLSPEGVAQAHAAGRALREAGIGVDHCFSSVLSRAASTAEIVLEELGLPGIPRTKTWRLNERRYGVLEGMPMDEAVRRYGAGQVDAWRNSADAVPPPSEEDAIRTGRDPLYRDVPPDELPVSESLREAFRRVVGCFEEDIRPLVDSGCRVLVVSHGNPIRALVARLSGLREDEPPRIGIRNASPLVYAPGPDGSFVPVPSAGVSPWLNENRIPS